MTVKLTFLGTSDQIPSRKRNHTAMLLTYNGENILIDCGEGTQRQFRKARINMGKITRILITHWHGDHIFGLPGLLSSLALSGYNKTLYLYGPKGTKAFMKKLLEVFKFTKSYSIEIKEIGTGKFLDMKDFYLEAKGMTHGIPTNAYSFVKKGLIRINKDRLRKSGLPQGPLLQKLKQGKNVKYKGKTYKAKDLTYKQKPIKVSIVMDTKFNQGIMPFVKNANLLVSEATFSHELKALAEEHMHLTAKQVAEIAKKAKVGRLVLTHMSQRYEKNPKQILDEAKKVFKNTIIAEDFSEFGVE
jgi:ribonuclease Z